MKRARLLTGLVGFAACVVVAIPVVQRLSIDLMQLQIRTRFIDANQRFTEIAEMFDLPPAQAAAKIGFAPLRPGEEMLTLGELAARRGVPIAVAKQRIAQAIIPRQFSGYAPLSSPDPAARNAE